jgi:hypothetical protein
MASSNIAAILEKLLGAAQRQDELLSRVPDGPGLGELSELVRQQRKDIQELTVQISGQVAHESQLRAQLLEAHEQLLRRDLEFERQMAAFQEARGKETERNGQPTPESRYLRYRHMLDCIKGVVETETPRGAVIIAVSKGDNELVRFEGRTGWHFPQTGEGTYAGHYPANSAAAIEHLTALRARGGGFLLFPGTAFWWLDHYREFADHLRTHYRCVHRDDYCLLYNLSAPAEEAT